LLVGTIAIVMRLAGRDIDAAIQSMALVGWTSRKEQRVDRLIGEAVAERDSPQAVDGDQPAMTPSSVAKMNRLGPDVVPLPTTKSPEPFRIKVRRSRGIGAELEPSPLACACGIMEVSRATRGVRNRGQR
jgi:hypothetical protein